jgi:hypothetical protein
MQLIWKINRLLFGYFLGTLFTKGGELAYDMKLSCLYTRQSYYGTVVFWCQRVAGTRKVGGPRLAGLCHVSALCRVLSGSSVVANLLLCALPVHHHGQGVCSVLAWPGT